jgi:RimJ/RimL family protein N-acetyltransferase
LRTAEEARWIAERAKVTWTEDANGIIAYRGEEIVGAVVFEQWTHNSAALHFAIGTPMILRHGFLEELFTYLFITAGRRIALGGQPSSNVRMSRFVEKLGFKEVHRIEDGFADGDDMIIYELRKEDCRFIDHGKEERSAAA